MFVLGLQGVSSVPTDHNKHCYNQPSPTPKQRVLRAAGKSTPQSVDFTQTYTRLEALIPQSVKDAIASAKTLTDNLKALLTKQFFIDTLGNIDIHDMIIDAIKNNNDLCHHCYKVYDCWTLVNKCKAVEQKNYYPNPDHKRQKIKDCEYFCQCGPTNEPKQVEYQKKLTDGPGDKRYCNPRILHNGQVQENWCNSGGWCKPHNLITYSAANLAKPEKTEWSVSNKYKYSSVYLPNNCRKNDGKNVNKMMKNDLFKLNWMNLTLTIPEILSYLGVNQNDITNNMTKDIVDFMKSLVEELSPQEVEEILRLQDRANRL